MAKKEDESLPSDVQKNIEESYISLRFFADQNALKYGVEMMSGFYHEQEIAKCFVDTEANWHKKIEEFKNKEV